MQEVEDEMAVKLIKKCPANVFDIEDVGNGMWITYLQQKKSLSAFYFIRMEQACSSISVGHARCFLFVSISAAWDVAIPTSLLMSWLLQIERGELLYGHVPALFVGNAFGKMDGKSM